MEESLNELTKVQVLVERCLLLYMSHDDVVETLKVQANIEPTLTELVWQRLQEQNKEFFKAYNLRLMLKNQITKYNELLEIQYKLMCQARAAEVGPVARSNGSHVLPLQCDSGLYAPFNPIVSNGLSNTFFDADVSQNTHMLQEMNGLNIGAGIGYVDNTHMPTNVMLQSSMPCLQGPNHSEQILRNISLLDFAADFGNSFGERHSFDTILDNGFNHDDFGSE